MDPYVLDVIASDREGKMAAKKHKQTWKKSKVKQNLKLLENDSPNKGNLFEIRKWSIAVELKSRKNYATKSSSSSKKKFTNKKHPCLSDPVGILLPVGINKKT